jgi:hypothetical protein
MFETLRKHIPEVLIGLAVEALCVVLGRRAALDSESVVVPLGVWGHDHAVVVVLREGVGNMFEVWGERGYREEPPVDENSEFGVLEPTRNDMCSESIEISHAAF